MNCDLPHIGISPSLCYIKVYKVGEEVEFVVTFSQSVTVSEGHRPFLSLSLGIKQDRSTLTADQREAKRESVYFLSMEVQENDNDSNGISLAKLNIDLNGGSIQDTSGQDLVNTIPQKYQNFPDVKKDLRSIS